MKKRYLASVLILLLSVILFYETGPKPKSGSPSLKKEVLKTSFSKTPNDIKKKNFVIRNKKIDRKIEMASKLKPVADCLENNLQPHLSLTEIMEAKGWTQANNNKIIKRNLIYKSGALEKRLSIVPGDNSKRWTVTLFDVDNEGLPIPLEKNQVLFPEDAEQLFASQLKGMALLSEEVLLEVDRSGFSGSVLMANNSVAKAQLFSLDSKKILECFSDNCHCNSGFN